MSKLNKKMVAMKQALKDMSSDGLSFNKSFDNMVRSDRFNNPGFKRNSKIYEKTYIP